MAGHAYSRGEVWIGLSFWLLNGRGNTLLFGTEAVNQQLVAHWPKLKALPIQFSTPQIAQISWYALEGQDLGLFFFFKKNKFFFSQAVEALGFRAGGPLFVIATWDVNDNPQACACCSCGLIAKSEECPLLSGRQGVLSSVHSFILQPQFLLNLAEHTLCQELFSCQVSGFKVLPLLSYSLLLSFCVSPSHLHTKLSF